MPHDSLLLRTMALFAAAPCFAQETAAPKPAPETIVVEGRVVDMLGDGMPAAAILVTPAGDPGTTLGKSTSDGDGYFRIGKVEKRASMYVVADCKDKSVGRAFTSGTGAVRVVVHDAANVRGVLTDRAGQPVKRAVVSAELMARALRTIVEATTDDEGRFVLTRVPLGPVRISAWIEGEGIAQTWFRVAGDCEAKMTAWSGKTTSLLVTVEGLPTPAPAASIRLLPYADGTLQQLPSPFKAPKLDKDSTWRAQDLPDHEFRVSLAATGFAFAPDEITCKPGAGPHKLVFRATATTGSRSLHCSFRLTDADDKPLAGVPLTLRLFSGGAQAKATSGDDGVVTFASPHAEGTKVVLTAEDDRWVLDQVKGEGMSGAWDQRFLRNHECVIDPKATPALRAIAACTVRGRVLLADGRPAAFALVELEGSHENRMPSWMSFARATTDRDGRYVFARQHPTPSPVRVHVQNEAGAVDGEPFALDRAGLAVAAADLKLGSPALIEGVVRDAANAPAPGVRVWLRDWEMDKNRQKSGSVVEVITDRQGRYRFLGVPPGGAWLQLLPEVTELNAFARAVEPFEVEAGKTYTFDLQVPAK